MSHDQVELDGRNILPLSLTRDQLTIISLIPV